MRCYDFGNKQGLNGGHRFRPHYLLHRHRTFLQTQAGQTTSDLPMVDIMPASMQ